MGGAFVAGHNAVVLELHDAVRDAKLAVQKEPRDWIDGQRTFGAGANGEPTKRPDLLIHLGHEDAVVVDVSITLGTIVSQVTQAVRNPQAPLDVREKATMRLYQRSSATKTVISSVVESSLGRFGASVGELLMRIAKRAFGEVRRAAGRWLSKWSNRTTETLMRFVAAEWSYQEARKQGVDSQFLPVSCGKPEAMVVGVCHSTILDGIEA